MPLLLVASYLPAKVAFHTHASGLGATALRGSVRMMPNQRTVISSASGNRMPNEIPNQLQNVSKMHAQKNFSHFGPFFECRSFIGSATRLRKGSMAMRSIIQPRPFVALATQHRSAHSVSGFVMEGH